MIRILVNDEVFTDFVNASCTRSMDSMANDFSFTASAINGHPPFNLGDEVQILVDGIVTVSGNIEDESGSEAEGSHKVVYSGRDFTADFIDSDFLGIGDLNSNISLAEIIGVAVNNILSDIKVIDNVKPELFNIAEDLIKPKDGDNCFEFCNDLAKKRQCILTSDELGNIVIDKSEPTPTDNILIRARGFESNIISQSWTKTNSSRFHVYAHLGQTSPIALNNAGEHDNNAIVSNNGLVYDKEVRFSRQKVKVESKSYSSDQLTKRSQWQKQRAKAEGQRFTCAIKGHSDQEGNPWRENTLCYIESEPARISAEMLLNTISWSYAEGSPTITTLNFVEKGIYDAE